MLNAAAQKIDARAVYLAKVHRKIELNLIDVLLQVQRRMIHRALGYSSLFKYVVERLKLSEAQAYALCSVTSKSEEFPELKSALRGGRLSVYRASRLASAIDRANAKELVSYACAHSTRETEQFIAKIRPRAAHPDRVSPITENLSELRVALSHSCLVKLKRAKTFRLVGRVRRPSRRCLRQH